MRKATIKTSNFPHQKGAALFMALIFLLILTILGVFGMNISRLENMMAGNNQFQTAALSNAELAVDAGGARFTGNDRGHEKSLLLPASHPGRSFAAQLARHHHKCSHITPPDVPDARYIVEYVGWGIDDDCGKSLGKGESKAGCIHYDFLVTAQADTSRGARRTVQTVYQSGTAP